MSINDENGIAKVISIYLQKFQIVPINILAGTWVMISFRNIPYMSSMRAKLARQNTMASMIITI
jgi:hypothetical protein